MTAATPMDLVPDGPPDRQRRDPEATRERILNAALTEFSRRGFAGARIQAIAARAGVNVRMLYHYFGDKDELYRAIRRRRFAERPLAERTNPASLGAQMAEWFTNVVANPDWVRLNEWESLEVGDDPVVEEEERRRRWAVAVERMGASGRFEDLDPELATLALVALATFPVAFGPLTRLVTGANPSEPAFQRRYAAFLRRLADHLSHQPSEASPLP